MSSSPLIYFLHCAGNDSGLDKCDSAYASGNRTVSLLKVHGNADIVVPWTGDAILGQCAACSLSVNPQSTHCPSRFVRLSAGAPGL